MTNLHKISSARDTMWSAFLTLSLFAVVMLLPDLALASGAGDTSSPLANVLCNLVEYATGPTGRALATLAIIIIGVGALMGKVSWGMAIIVALGVAIIFGAPTIVKTLGAGDDTCSTSTTLN